MDHPGHPRARTRRGLRALTPRPEIAAILSAPLPETTRSAEPQPAADQPAEPAAVAPRVVTVERNGTRPNPEAPAAATGKGMVPTPKDVAGIVHRGHSSPHPASPSATGATLRWSSDRGLVGGAEAADVGLPTLAQLTSPEQRWADREEDITAVSGDPYEVGQVFARRWIGRLTDTSHLQVLSAEYPRVPHRIDGELLRYAARFGLLAHKDDQIDEHDRYAIRAGFWREIDARAVVARASAGE